MMILKKYTFSVLFLFIIYVSFAQKVSENEIKEVATTFLIINNKTELLNQKPEIKRIYSDSSGKLLCYVYNYTDAFFVFSADKSNSPVKAFSFNHPLRTDNNNFQIHLIDIIKNDYDLFDEFLLKNPEIVQENQKKWEDLLLNSKTKSINDATYGPFLSSLYGQVNCHDNNGNLVNVTNYYTPNHYAVGCVALTFTEVMGYYGWPRKGVGSFSYTDSYGNSTGAYDANFEDGYYNWGLIQDRYDGVASTDQSRSELGKVAFHAAVSVKMDFENGGSTSNINRIPSAASKYFRYTADYKEKSASDFWQTLDTNLHNGIPAQFAIYTSGGTGHAVVGDGIQYIGSEKYYHLNMGWWGDDNGWYQIHQSFNAGGYTNVTAAVLNMIPVPEMDDSPELNIEELKVNLKWYYSDKISVQNYELQMKKGPAEWETLTDTLTQKIFSFQADKENDYSFRVRAKNNDEWNTNGWSNEIKIIPSDFKAEGDDELTLYPTVAYDIIKVSYKYLSGSSLKIFDLSGHLIKQNKTVNDNEYSFDISDLETGFYILQLSGTEGKKTAKFLKL